VLTLVSLKGGTESGAEFVKIGLSDGSSLSLKSCYLPEISKNPAFWEEGREISSAEEEELRFAGACYRAERAGLRLIARAEQTETGLFIKLQHRGHSSASAAVVVSRFASLGFINDERYAELWVRARLVRKGGKVPTPRRLLASLKNRGIDSSAAGKALKNSLDTETEFALLRRYIEKSAPKEIHGFSLRNFLKFEGFSSDVISLYLED
jgi:regulatory protein